MCCKYILTLDVLEMLNKVILYEMVVYFPVVIEKLPLNTSIQKTLADTQPSSKPHINTDTAYL